MRRVRPLRATAAAAAVCLTAAGVAATGTAAGATTSWSPTATQAVPTGKGITADAPLAGATPMTVQVVLGLRNRDALDRGIAAGTVLSTDQFVAQYAPTADQVAAVQSYLRSEGLSTGAVSANRELVSASGPASAVQAAFHTTLSRVTARGASGFANLTGASVPASLGSTVIAVQGLNDVFAAHRAATNPPKTCTIPGAPAPCSYNPQGFQRAYHATGTPTGAQTAEAIFTEGDMSGVVADLRTEEKANGLPQVPVSIVGPGSSDTSGTDEWDMDTQYSTGMAQTVKRLYIYDAASLDDAPITASFERFVSDNAAKAGSASFGGCEFEAYLDGTLQADDQLFAQAAAQGQTVFASAGDTGGFCSVGTPNGVPAGVPDVEWPAVSPYVVGVGGTTLLTKADSSYQGELAWLAGGGGIGFEKQPAWQASDGFALNGLGRRTLPDVSMAADPNSGANVYVAGKPETVGGTSLSSPLALGVWDRIESARANAAGFASPQLYRAAKTAAFHDVVLGDNGPYPATPGYDLATGIGSFDVAKAVALVK